MTNMQEPSILVVGAGIAGLAVARALGERGLGCTVAEQRSSAPRLGMGLNLPGNAVRALEALGVADQVLAHGVPVRRREYRNGRGRLLFSVDDEAFWQGVGGPVCVRHGHLLDALRPPGLDAATHGTHVVEARPGPRGVDVLFEGEEGRRYDFVVGADGVHSSMRGAIVGDAVRPSSMTSSSWRFVADNPGVDCWTAWSGSTETILLIPVEPGRVYGYAASTRGGATGTVPDWLRDAFARFPTPVTEVIDNVLADGGELHHAPVDEVRVSRWHNGRLVLIGDAAHATGPVWAQGAAMALEDALALVGLLGVSSDWTGVGAEFDRLRRPRVAHVQAATDRMSRLARLPGPLRDLVAPLLGPRAYRAAYEPLRAT